MTIVIDNKVKARADIENLLEAWEQVCESGDHLDKIDVGQEMADMLDYFLRRI